MSILKWLVAAAWIKRRIYEKPNLSVGDGVIHRRIWLKSKRN